MFLFAGLLALSACSRNPSLSGANANIQVTPAALSFGGVFVQAQPQRSVSVTNTGEAPDSVTATLTANTAGAFSVTGAGGSVAGGTTLALPVTFAPTSPGSFSAALNVQWTNGSTDVAISGEGLPWPACAAASPCQSAAFDPSSGACQQSPVPDGAACDAGVESCLTGTLCVSGQCLGQPLDCDDHDSCTVNSCVPGQGCQHQPVQCTGTNPCQSYGCDPKSGCQSSALPDGTPCAITSSCQAAAFCLSGSCVSEPVPNGTPCQVAWAPCVSDATCQAGICDSPEADGWQPGQVVWRDDFSDGGPYEITPWAIDDGGNLYASAASDPLLPVEDLLLSFDACGRERWSVSLVEAAEDGMLAGDQLIVLEDGTLESRSVATGQVGWQLYSAGPYSIGALSARPLLTNQGQILLVEPWGANLAAASVSLVGQVSWTRLLPVPDGGPLTASFAQSASDALGNFYLYADETTPNGTSALSLLSFDTSGNLRFAVPSDYVGRLAVGTSSLLEVGGDGSGGEASALTLQNGSWLYGTQEANYFDNAVIDAQGNSTLLGGNIVTRVDAAGQLIASAILPVTGDSGSCWTKRGMFVSSGTARPTACPPRPTSPWRAGTVRAPPRRGPPTWASPSSNRAASASTVRRPGAQDPCCSRRARCSSRWATSSRASTPARTGPRWARPGRAATAATTATAAARRLDPRRRRASSESARHLT